MFLIAAAAGFNWAAGLFGLKKARAWRGTIPSPQRRRGRRGRRGSQSNFFFS
jgi:hypothetical protein